jgi:hypothetical protein
MANEPILQPCQMNKQLSWLLDSGEQPNPENFAGWSDGEHTATGHSD